MPSMSQKLCVALCLLAALFASEARAAWVWTPETRRWINPKHAAKDTPQAQLEWAVNFFEAGEYERAAKEFIRLVRSYPRAEQAPEAQYLAGVCYELMGYPRNAVAAYEKVIEIYPFSVRFKDAVEREFLIAERFFEGQRMELIGFIKVPALDKAVEIYQHVVDHAPYGEYGDKAQLRLGESFLKQRRYEQAQRAFQRLLDDYPASGLREEAEFKVAFCARQLSLRASYDQSATDEAIAWFEDFIRNHPESDLVAEAQASLAQLREIKAKGLFEIAEFYEIQGKGRSAAYYYREVVEQYPGTAHAGQAVAKLKALKQQGVLEE